MKTDWRSGLQYSGNIVCPSTGPPTTTSDRLVTHSFKHFFPFFFQLRQYTKNIFHSIGITWNYDFRLPWVVIDPMEEVYYRENREIRVGRGSKNLRSNKTRRGTKTNGYQRWTEGEGRKETWHKINVKGIGEMRVPCMRSEAAWRFSPIYRTPCDRNIASRVWCLSWTKVAHFLHPKTEKSAGSGAKVETVMSESFPSSSIKMDLCDAADGIRRRDWDQKADIRMALQPFTYTPHQITMFNKNPEVINGCYQGSCKSCSSEQQKLQKQWICQWENAFHEEDYNLEQNSAFPHMHRQQTIENPKRTAKKNCAKAGGFEQNSILRSLRPR